MRMYVCVSRKRQGLNYLELYNLIFTVYTHTQRHTCRQIHLQRLDQAEVFLRQWNVFLVFISGFGTQSGHLVTVMEQSISARSYRGMGRWVREEWGRNWGGLTHILKRFISLQNSRERMSERIKIRKGGGGWPRFILLQNPWAETCPHGDRSPQQLPLMFTVEQRGFSAGGSPLIKSETHPDTLFSLQSLITYRHTHTWACTFPSAVVCRGQNH